MARLSGRDGRGDLMQHDPRTRALLEAPLVPTLLRLAAPNILVMFVQASIGLIEAYFIGKLGTEPLAGVALAFPLLMLMQMMAGGAVGGGISSAIARALGGGRREDADALAVHALIVGVGIGLFFMVLVLAFGRPLYTLLGGRGASLDAALTYSNVIFAGIVLLWLFNSLANVLRGTGNMVVPMVVTCGGALLVVPLSPALIFGWGPFPALGVAGGALAVLVYYAVGAAAFALYLWSGRSVVKPALHGIGFRWPLFSDILRVGAVAAIVSLTTNVTIAVATAFTAAFGAAAIAGYGVGSRLEYLLIPLAFGFGGPLVALVGTNIGAGNRARAVRAAWIGSIIAGLITEVIGLAAAAVPDAWLTLFGQDPAMIAAGSQYLRTVGPFYGFFGLGMSLYFASQGAGRLKWPLLANLMRLAIAAGGGWLVLQTTQNLTHIFIAQSVALAAFGTIVAIAVARGAWFTK